MDIWRKIDSSPGYSVSNRGYVRNDETNKILAIQKNQAQIIYVVLFENGKRKVRTVATLVAEAFVPVPFNNPRYNTVIHLDGDKTNVNAENLAWRERWYAIAYHKQFERSWPGLKVPIECIDTGEIFPNSWEAAIHYGVIESKLVVDLCNEVATSPIDKRFRVYEKG